MLRKNVYLYPKNFKNKYTIIAISKRVFVIGINKNTFLINLPNNFYL